jgi:hypothetical protein
LGQSRNISENQAFVAVGGLKVDRIGQMTCKKRINLTRDFEQKMAAGHAVLACGEAVRPRATVAVSMKHEPTEWAVKAA